MNLNALKGILIILVVIDHNEFSRSIFPRFLDGFGFHVLGFLAIPFLKPAAALNRDFANYAFRLYFPFFVIVTLMALVVAMTTPVGVAAQLQAWALALYSGNSDALKLATRMALLWFLPSFIALAAIRTAIENAGAGVKAAAIALLCAAHLFIGTVAPQTHNYLPLGLLPALYVIPLAYLAVWAHRSVYERLPSVLAMTVATGVFVVVKNLQMRAHLYNEVGFAEVADYTNPYALLLNDLESITGVLMLFQLCRLPIVGFVEACGRYSIQIYLFHAFVALLIYKLLLKFAAGAGSVILFAASMAATVALTLVLARWLAGNRLAQRFLFPRSPRALLSGEGANQAPAPAAAGALLPQAGSNPDVLR